MGRVVSLQDYEMSNRYEALDDVAVADGRMVGAHELRAMAKPTNYLVKGKGHELLSLQFDARIAGNSSVPIFPGFVDAVAGLSWGRLLAGRWQRPKLPGLNTMDVIMQARLSPPGTSILFQFETQHGVIDMTATGPSERVFGVVAPASYPDVNATSTIAFRNIPIDEGPYERIGFWVRGQPTTTLGDVSTHCSTGGVNAARIKSITKQDNNSLLEARASDPVTDPTGIHSDTLWIPDNLSPRQVVGYYSGHGLPAPYVTFNGTIAVNHSWATDHYAQVHSGPSETVIGATYYQAQIVAVPDTTKLLLYPALPGPFTARHGGSFFRIMRLPWVQIVSISCFANPRTS